MTSLRRLWCWMFGCLPWVSHFYPNEADGERIYCARCGKEQTR